MILLGSAAAASVSPAYADWLKDLSLMPPVSVTMQALNLAAVAGAVRLLEAPLDELLPDELEPHAAASRATTPSYSDAPEFPLTVTSSAGAAGWPPRRAADLIAKPSAGQGKEVPKAPRDCPKASPEAPSGEVGSPLC